MHLEDLYMSAQHSYKPNSFLGMVAVKEKIADRWGGRGEGEGECPLLHETWLIISGSSLQNKPRVPDKCITKIQH